MSCGACSTARNGGGFCDEGRETTAAVMSRKRSHRMDAGSLRCRRCRRQAAFNITAVMRVGVSAGGAQDDSRSLWIATAIVNSRGIQDLHPDEDNVLSRALDTFESKRAEIENAANQTETEHFALALDYLNRNWARLSDEVGAVNAPCPHPHRRNNNGKEIDAKGFWRHERQLEYT